MVGIRYLGTLLLLFFLFFSPAYAATSVNLFQITTDGSQQKDPLIDKNLVVYTTFGGSGGIDIEGYDLREGQFFPIITKPGQQFATSLHNKLIIYDDYDDGNPGPNYDVRLYNLGTGKDQLIAGGAGDQVGGVTNGRDVVYLDGGFCGAVHIYNLKKGSDEAVGSTGCAPLRISGDIVIWANGAPGGTNIYGYNLKDKLAFDVVNDPGYQESPNIFENKVVYLDYVSGPTYGDYNAIKMKDLKTGEEKTIYETNVNSVQWPAVSGRYVVWSESSAQHINGVKAANLKTGEVFEVQPQGSHQNSHTSPAIWKNTAVWMSWRTGNGDIYGAKFTN